MIPELYFKAEHLLFRDTIHSGTPSPSLNFVERDVSINADSI